MAAPTEGEVVISDEAVARLQRRLKQNFGQDFGADMCRELLMMCGGDEQAVVSFIQLPAGEPEVQMNPDGIPTGYFDVPRGVDKFKALKNAHDAKKPRVNLRFKSLFLQDASFGDHLLGQVEDGPMYYSVLLLLLRQKVDMSSATKARVLGACLARRDFEISNYLLSMEDQFGLPEVLRACTLLDTPRRIRQLERKLERRRVGALRARLNALREDEVNLGDTTGVRLSLTNGICKRIARWVNAISPAALTFYALSLPKEPWRELADMIHLRPSDFQLDWFLPVVFGADPPADSVVARCEAMDDDNMLEICREHRVPYSYIRRTFVIEALAEDVKEEIARYETLKCVLWYYEELCCQRVDDVILGRLTMGEEPDLSYGKIMERLLMLQKVGASFLPALIPIAERRMGTISLPLEPPVVVLGDASYSMDVAIRTATIIASLLSFLADAELKFFNDQLFDPPLVPRTIEEVLRVATDVRADGLTAPACAMWHYYNTRTVVNVFVVVSDEIENVASEDCFFGQLFLRYYNEVHPAKIVFVSFLEKDQQKGRMVQSLENLGIIPLQFRLDQSRPDLSKLDALIGTLSAETDFFSEETNALATALSSGQTLESTIRSMIDAARAAGGGGSSEAGSSSNPAVAPPSAAETDRTCVVCMDAPRNACTLECGHVMTCTDCVVNLDTCAICRAPIVRWVKVYQ